MTTKFIYYSGWSIVLAASFYFIYNNALHYFSYGADNYGAGFWPYAPFLLMHIICGIAALLLGPFQFIAAIRKNYPKTHRLMGKIYLCSIVVAAFASLYLSINKIIIGEKAVAYGTGLAGLAIAWLLTSGMAYWSVRSKNFVQHREWMVRSFVVTCAFTSFRLVDKLLVGQLHMDPGASATLMAWACWTFPLMITELFLQGSKIRRGNLALQDKKKIMVQAPL
jgi:uncharacterized membrane protein